MNVVGEDGSWSECVRWNFGDITASVGILLWHKDAKFRDGVVSRISIES